MNILIINGCNLNLLGTREPSIYGKESYKDLSNYIKKLSKEISFKYKMVQSNYEGQIIEWIQRAPEKYDAVIINPGAFTHYSYGIRDAISSINLKVIEVHLSNINEREEFRKISVIKDVCYKQITGLHFESYKEAIKILIGGKNNA